MHGSGLFPTRVPSNCNNNNLHETPTDQSDYMSTHLTLPVGITFQYVTH